MTEHVAARPHRLLIGGKWVEDRETMPVIDKYSGETIATVPVASRGTVEKASGAARNTALDAAVSAAEGARGCDGKKTDLLKKALQDLRAPAM